MYVGEPHEYKNLSKFDDRGQYRRAKQHHGQFVYEDNKGKFKVRPVYAFESKQKVKNELLDSGYRIIGFFETGCLIEIQRDIDFGDRIIPSGKYILGTIKSNGQVKIKSSRPEFEKAIGINHLVKAGFCRVK